jgi:glycosyltransferase involved in cell wall biosynthesis
MPKLVFIRNFGIQKSGITAFVLFNVPAIFFLIKKKINKEIDFLYFRSSYFLPLATSAYILGIPFFYETHRRPVSRSERCRDHAMSAMATGFIVISSYMREHYLPYKKKILVAHDAVSLKRFAGAINKDEARKKLGLAPDEKVCVYAGTVSKLKGMEYVIAAAKILPKILFLLVGFVSMEFTNDSLPKNVKLLGRVGQEDLPAILQAADILLLPHPKGEYSQSPMKLFEYMASSVPIVASRLPSISEVLNDNNAVLVEAENEEALARGVERLIKDRNLSRVIAEKAYSDVQDYTWKKRGATIAEFIRKVIREQNKK